MPWIRTMANAVPFPNVTEELGHPLAPGETAWVSDSLAAWLISSGRAMLADPQPDPPAPPAPPAAPEAPAEPPEVAVPIEPIVEPVTEETPPPPAVEPPVERQVAPMDEPVEYKPRRRSKKP